MDAFILHADGDEDLGRELAQRIAPATSLDARLAVAGGLSFGDHLMVLAIWSARAEEAGLARQLADIARRVGERCIIVRADGTPLPAIAGAAQVAVLHGRDNDFLAMLKVARLRTRPAAAPVAASSGFKVSGVGPGVGVGLAIYAGMFVAAGAWRSEDITQAIETGKEAPAVVALRSFQTAFDAPETAHVTVASAAPNARFVQPQRVILTATMDSASLPVVAAGPSDSSVTLDRVDDAVEAPRRVATPAIAAAPLTPIPQTPDLGGSGAASLGLIALDGISTLQSIDRDSF